MNFAIHNEEFISKLNRTLFYNFQPKDTSYRPAIRSYYTKTFGYLEILEICLLILIVLEHTFIFLLTFKKKSIHRTQKSKTPRLVLLPSKSFLYSCLHRNWIRAFSFSNISLSIVYFFILLLKHYHPNLIHHSAITFYSLPLNLLQQILINFTTFHLLIISISVFQYFLRYYRLVKNTYSSYFFNGRNLLLTKHTNIALILSGSLALILAYNYIFYTPKYPQTISLLPLVTFNMILLPLINVIIFLFLFICLMINIFFKSNFDLTSIDNDQENLRFLIEKSTCMKCYSKILEKNPNLFQDKNYSYRNLYQNFFSRHLRSSYPFQIPSANLSKNKKANLSYEQTNLFNSKTLNRLNHQHSLCHLCSYLLFIFLLKYILFTFPHYLIQMLFHLKQFYQFILKNNLSNNFAYSLYENNETLLTMTHFLFLLSRLGDTFLLIRISYLIKKYFPCWCHWNSKLLRKEQISQQRLTIKTSESSNNEPLSALDMSNSNELDQQEAIEKTPWQPKHRHFRLQFRFIPLWSRHRPRLYRESL